MPPPPTSHEIASLKADLQAALNEDPLNTEQLISRVDQLAWSVGSGLYSGLLLLLCNIDVGEEEARRLWDAARDHRLKLEQQLGRSVALRVALLDHFIATNRHTSRARMLDMIQTHRPGEREMSDTITRLHTAAFFNDQLPREIGRARRYTLPIALVHAEIDGFAGIVERFGVSIGSVLLKEVSSVIAGSIRDMDYAARMEGARFSLLLTETDRMGAYYVADRLRQQVEAYYLERQIDGRPFAITVSAGVAAFPQDADSAEDLVAKACEAYYNARARGPGSVAIHYRERREYIRLESPTDRLKVTLLPEGDSSAALADMKNISSGGVLFESDRPMQLGRMVQIQCRNLQEGDEVLIPGRVVRIERFDVNGAERYEIGVLFDLVVEQQLEGVIGFLERFTAGEETPGFDAPTSGSGSDPAGTT